MIENKSVLAEQTVCYDMKEAHRDKKNAEEAVRMVCISWLI